MRLEKRHFLVGIAIASLLTAVGGSIHAVAQSSAGAPRAIHGVLPGQLTAGLAWRHLGPRDAAARAHNALAGHGNNSWQLPPQLQTVLAHRPGAALNARGAQPAMLGAGVLPVDPTPAETLRVCMSGCPYTQLAPALAVAKNGDTIAIGPGTYAGGVTVDVSVKLVGAGSRSTIISGGSSVLTIGVYGAATEPTVSIAGVTITGGVARSSPESSPFVGKDGVLALGGGVEIPPNAAFSGGATVTLSNSVVSGNLVDPTTPVDSGIPCPADITIPCINGDLPFAQASGGGIDSWGRLTLANTTVSHNRVGAATGLSDVASDANGGAIQNWLGPLTISNSRISGNQTSAAAPNGRFADSGGIFVEGGSLDMHNSAVSNNAASLAAAMPSDVASGTLAIAGGVHISSSATAATISNSSFTGNSAIMTNTVGDATAFSGGLHTDGVFQLSKDAITNNSVTSTTLPGSTGNAYGDSGAGEMGGTIANTRLTGNTVTAISAAGTATAVAGAAIFAGSMTNSIVNSNRILATAPEGAAIVFAGGLQIGDVTTLRNSTINDNEADADGETASAQGGGVYDAAAASNGPPGGSLVLLNSRVTENALSGSSGAILQGGGVYIQNEQLTATHSVIERNSPDQCYGC